MTCDLTADLKQFPDASDVVRVGSERWTERHTNILEALCEGVQDFLRARRHLPLKKLREQYEKIEPAILVDGDFAQLMYGRTGAFFLDGSQLKMDIKGLVFVKQEAMGA